MPGVGTIVFEEPLSRQEGFYQCQAYNTLGRAVSTMTHLRKATLEPFPVVNEPRVVRPEVGKPQVLRCNPPLNYPKGSISWEVSEKSSTAKAGGAGSSSKVEISKRIAQDFEGHLYFSNVISEDSQNGKIYICEVFNPRLRTASQGDDQRIEPQSIVETPDYQAPEIMWSSDTVTTAIKGEQKRLKCIFSGYPTPNVTWTRVDSQMTDDVKFEDHGRQLFIPKADHVHVGKYRCSGSNSRVQASPVSRDFDLFVESPPFWIDKMTPKQVAEEENAQFKCNAGGAPAPKVEWLINGKKVQSMESDSRRVVGTNTLSYTNVSKTDSMVLQCNVSNKHGYIFTNAYLNVLAEPPSFTAPLSATNKVAMRQNLTIKCEVFGAPTPKKVWKKRIEPKTPGGKATYKEVLNDPRFKQLDNGDLLIMGAMDTDKGMYTCIASNKFGSVNQTGSVVVRNATEITAAPESKNVKAGENVVFQCSATTDKLEERNLKYQWLRDGKPIDFEQEGRISYNTDDHSLIINQVAVADNGTFTCVVDNGLDKEEATASLIVRDRPDKPYNVLLTSCMTRAATITWLPGNENNDEVQWFRVYYNSSHDEPGEYHFKKKTRRGVHSASITLAPYAKYQFYVVAKNSVGLSDKSEFTPKCETPPQRPDVNPRNVCTRSGEEDQLTITWEPMEKSEQNGPDFYYKVGYKPLSEENQDYKTDIVRDAQQGEYVVKDTPMFTPYLVYVQAINRVGPSYSLEETVGFSGEGVPSAVPENFGLSDLFAHNGSSAIFVWDRVPDDRETIKGHLKGYQIQFWRTDEPDVVRARDVFRDPIKNCMSQDEYNQKHNPARFRRQAPPQQVHGHVHNLWADSEIEAGVLVMNGKSSGKLGPTIKFDTPEGVPSQVARFEVAETGSHHIIVEWDEPDEHNGKLIGYVLQYKGENDDQGTEEIIDDLENRRHKLRPLTNDTMYTIVLRGRTATGSGPPYILEEKTLSVSAPDIPLIDPHIETGDDYFNVSWTPSDGEKKNPGAEFCLEYKKEGEDTWTRTDCVHDKNWVNVTGLTKGDKYKVRVVSRNGVGDEKESKERDVVVGVNQDDYVAIETTPPLTTEGPVVVVQEVQEPVLASIASAWWFIILMIIIALLLLILIIVCLVRRNRGGKYPVHEKEKLRGKDPEKDDLDTPYGEYTRTDTPEKKSQLSFTDDLPPPESDIDSMAEYYETDPSKFNEDGSFIGQYGGKGGKRDSRLGPETEVASPNALSTFV